MDSVHGYHSLSGGVHTFCTLCTKERIIMMPTKDNDLEVSLSACRKTNTYAFSVDGCRSLARNSCGVLKSATSDTLLSYALLSCLKGIDKRAAMRVFIQTREIQTAIEPSTYHRRLKIRIRLNDAGLLEVLQSAYSSSTTRVHANRANKNLFTVLVTEMRRFDLTFSLVPRDNLRVLHNWATQTVPSFSSQDMVMPSAVSQLT